MLKKLTGRHRDVIRRLLVGQTPGEVQIELGMSASYLSVLQADPLFKEAYALQQRMVDEKFLEGRATTMEILEVASRDAADIAIKAMRDGRISGVGDEGEIIEREISATTQLSSAWDVLNRTGNKAPERKLIGTFDAAELVKAAYAGKYKEEKKDETVGDEMADEAIDAEFNDCLPPEGEPEDRGRGDEEVDKTASAEFAQGSDNPLSPSPQIL